jgi:hypothetical protein
MIHAMIVAMTIYSYPAESDITGIRRPFDRDDEQNWQEETLYARRHDGLYESRLETMQREWMEENEE